jgi:hypothetical protein
VAAARAFAAQVNRHLRDDPCPWWWARYEAALALANQASVTFHRYRPC